MISLIATTLLPGVLLLLSEDGKEKGQKESRRGGKGKKEGKAGKKVGCQQISNEESNGVQNQGKKEVRKS